MTDGARNDDSKLATTTAEEDRVTHGQRRINLLWEVTQSLIALVVTSSTLYVAAKRSSSSPSETAAFLLLSNGFFLVIGFYFGRTNHSRTGGVGRVLDNSER